MTPLRLCFFQLLGAFYFHTFRNSSGSLAIFAAIRATFRVTLRRTHEYEPGSNLAFLSPCGEFLIILRDPQHDRFRLGFFHFAGEGADFWHAHAKCERCATMESLCAVLH